MSERKKIGTLESSEDKKSNIDKYKNKGSFSNQKNISTSQQDNKRLISQKRKRNNYTSNIISNNSPLKNQKYEDLLESSAKNIKEIKKNKEIQIFQKGRGQQKVAPRKKKCNRRLSNK